MLITLSYLSIKSLKINPFSSWKIVLQFAYAANLCISSHAVVIILSIVDGVLVVLDSLPVPRPAAYTELK